MMNPDERARRYEDLTFEIMFHKYLYFEFNQPVVSDDLYLSLREEYLQLGADLGYETKWFHPCLHFAHGHPLAQKVAFSAKKFLGIEL